ncbi:hypothetical protein NB636_08150 [Oxalobacter aliiformigenes]|uniref:hypothetical protein n=1 Tax=Oxalobacter aliiformigenes TaxID=2946593 RepID=UPI0022AE9B65|nr:hypothetical protein [Oxalobacter aliiformigenes]MCZ4065926.1 hypothetical protein [Oxalobacter aliiformigenes]WAV98679.1 hypothetical protein NB636_08150 [Oxalobacter aliiformigenes]
MNKEALEQLQDKLIRLGDRIVDGANIAIDKLPEVYQQLYWAKVTRMRIEAGFLVAAMLIGIALSAWMLRKCFVRMKKYDDLFPAYIIGFIASIVIVFLCFLQLMSGKLWLRLINPEIILWSDFLDSVVGTTK